MDWSEEVANHREGREGVAASALARWGTPTPVPATLTQGNKRMAVCSRRPARQARPKVLPMPTGFAAASALELILAAIARAEQRTEERFRTLAAEAEEREKRIHAKLLAY